MPVAQPIALARRSGAQAWLKNIAVTLIFIASLCLVVRPIIVDAPRPVISSAQIEKWQAQLTPLSKHLHERDQQALRNLQGSMQDDFIEWENRVPGFIDDLNGLGSQLGMLGMMIWDGHDQTALAVQSRFQEQVVSDKHIRRVMQSHITDFQQQLTENRQDFFIATAKILDDSNFPPIAVSLLHRRLDAIQQQQLAMADQVAIKMAAAPILSVITTYMAQQVAGKLLAKLPVRLGSSLLMKVAKSNWITAIVGFGADYVVSNQLEAAMETAVQQQMNQSEHAVSQALRVYGIRQIHSDEAMLAKITEQSFAEVNQ